MSGCKASTRSLLQCIGHVCTDTHLHPLPCVSSTVQPLQAPLCQIYSYCVFSSDLRRHILTAFFLFLPEKAGKRTKSKNLVRFLLFWTISRKIFSQTRLLCLEHIESGIIVSARHILSDYLSRRCVAGDESEVHQLIAIA